MRLFILALCVLSCQAAREYFFQCKQPTLINGFFHPDWSFNDHGSKVTYSCIEGMKPLSGTWWGVTTCQNGKWSPVPRCIDASLCLTPNVPNAKPNSQLLKIYTNGSSVEFACERGYKSDAGHVAECVDGQWKLPVCKRKPLTCDPPARVYGAAIVQQYQAIFEEGDTIEYACGKGYELVGQKFSSCRQKRWNSVPKCAKRTNKLDSPSQKESRVEWGPLNCQRPAFEGGFLYPDMEDYKPGSNVSYSCHRGLKPLIGTWWGVITCQDRVWSHTPQCFNASSCLTPDVPNASPDNPVQEIYRHGEYNFYSCDKGYQHQSIYYAQCVAGQWNLPVCIRQKGSCDPPARVDHALIEQPYQTFFESGKRIKYLCEKGHMIVGETISTCQESQWTSAPTCPIIVNCPPPTIKDGFFDPTLDVYEHGAKVYYSCNEGMKLELYTWWGQITCSNGTWSPAAQCIDESNPDIPSPDTEGGPACYPPDRLHHAIIKSLPKDQYDIGDRIEYGCESGYELAGEKVSGCTRDGWTSTPTCDVLHKCQPDLEDGFFYPGLDSYSHGSTIFYGCNKGLKPAFKAWWGETTCEKGTWSHTPLCINETSCLAPNVPNSKPVRQLEIFYLNGSSVEFVCNRGYESDTGHHAECLNSQWKLPVCKRKPFACDPPARVSDATIVQRYQEIFEEGDTLEYACAGGYELVGEKFSSCRQKQWTSAPTCVPKKDEPVPKGSPVQAGPLNCRRPTLGGGFFHPDMDDYEPGSNVSYSCHGGLKAVIGTWWGVMTCQDGVWSHNPSCVGEELCLAPPMNLDNGRLKDPPLAVYPFVFSTVDYTCDRGYSFPYRHFAECVRGKWKLPSCTRKLALSYCDPPPRVENAVINQPYGVVFGNDDVVEYACRKGYELVGKKFSTCQFGSWTPLPTCVAKEEIPNPTESPFQPVRLCGRRPYVANADVWEQPGGMELKVQCYEHYEHEGEEKITCLDGKWSALPACTPECEVDMSLFNPNYFVNKYIKNGVRMSALCRYPSYWRINVRCVNGKTLYKGCGFNDW